MCIRDRRDDERKNERQQENVLQLQVGELIKLMSLIHISEPTRQAEISYAVFCLKKNAHNKNLNKRAGGKIKMKKKNRKNEEKKKERKKKNLLQVRGGDLKNL